MAKVPNGKTSLDQQNQFMLCFDAGISFFFLTAGVVANKCLFKPPAVTKQHYHSFGVMFLTM